MGYSEPDLGFSEYNSVAHNFHIAAGVFELQEQLR